MGGFPFGYGGFDLRRCVGVSHRNIGVNVGLPVVTFFVQTRCFSVVPEGALVHVGSFAVTFLRRIGNSAQGHGLRSAFHVVSKSGHAITP
jgi:hypothetical protein